MDKIEYLFYIGLCLASFNMGATFPKNIEEVNPWLFRVGVVISLTALSIKYTALSIKYTALVN